MSDVKGKDKGFYRYIMSTRKTRENVDLLLGRAADMLTKDTGEAWVFNATFVSAFTGKICLLESQTSETSGKVQSEENTLMENQDSELGTIELDHQMYGTWWDMSKSAEETDHFHCKV